MRSRDLLFIRCLKLFIRMQLCVDLELISHALTGMERIVDAATMRVHLRVGAALVSGIVFTLFAATAQEALQPVMKPGDAGRLTVEPDKEKEDQVAKLFEGIRAEAKLPPLMRIQHRANLEQGVCMSALNDKPLKFGNVFYTTTDPESTTPELKKIASSNRIGSNKQPWYSRYSVAVWKAKDPQAGNVVYWVGLGLYETAVGEFVDCHFTDDIYYCGKWKESITPPVEASRTPVVNRRLHSPPLSQGQ
jgi:hypothetical protein